MFTNEYDENQATKINNPLSRWRERARVRVDLKYISPYLSPFPLGERGSEHVHF